LKASLAVYNGRIAGIKQQFGGVKVASTEGIFVYLANATGLDLVLLPHSWKLSPKETIPSAEHRAVRSAYYDGTVKVLVYNAQTVTPLTQSTKALASQYNIPIVPVTETIQPPDASFQVWMNAQLIILRTRLTTSPWEITNECTVRDHHVQESSGGLPRQHSLARRQFLNQSRRVCSSYRP